MLKHSQFGIRDNGSWAHIDPKLKQFSVTGNFLKVLVNVLIDLYPTFYAFCVYSPMHSDFIQR